MGRGILSGLIWGSIISIAVLGTVSQLAPMAPVDATSSQMGADQPSGTEGSKPGSEQAVDESTPEAGDGGDADVADLESPDASPLMESPETDSPPEPASDPGASNWIDTAGHGRGTMCVRWVRAERHPEPLCQVVKLADL